MQTFKMDTDINDFLNETIQEAAADLIEKHPDLTYGAASGASRIDLALQVMFPGGDPKKMQNIRALILGQLVKDKVDWAENYRTTLAKTYRPAYDSALAAGVEPAPVIAANCKISLKEARALARTFKKEDSNSAPDAGSVENSAPDVEEFDEGNVEN